MLLIRTSLLSEEIERIFRTQSSACRYSNNFMQLHELPCNLRHVIDNQDLVDDRHASLLKQLATERRIFTNEAAIKFGVSVDTIRRDLRTLHKHGHLKRVHGGAVQVPTLPSSFVARSSTKEGTTRKLAAAVASRFEPGQVIGLDAGSTNVMIAASIPRSLQITIVTNNPAAALALADHSAATVLLLGGKLDVTWMATVGPEVVDGWRDYRLDIGVIGVCGFDVAVGATSTSQAEIATKRALIESSAETIIPLQAAKIGVVAPFVIAGATQIDTIVIDPAPVDDASIGDDNPAQVIAATGTEDQDPQSNPPRILSSTFSSGCLAAGIHLEVAH